MIEILCVIWLLNQNGKIAISRGQNPSKYRIITLTLWFGLEVLGTMAGTMFAMTFVPERKPLMIAYAFGITGALLGALLSRIIVSKAPIGNYKQPDIFNRNQNIPDNMSSCNSASAYQPDNSAQNIMSESLSVPATIHLVNEYYWNETTQDLFFLNGIPICTLSPGTEYTFLTNSVKNIFTVGRPYLPKEDIEHSIRFIASDDGHIEIIVKDGRIVSDCFKNYKK